MSTLSRREFLAAARHASASLVCWRSEPVKLDAQMSGTTRSFEGMAYNGGVMYPTLVVGRETVTGPVVIDLDSVIIPSQKRPVLDEHDDSTDGLIGTTTELSVQNNTLPVKGVLYVNKERTQKILSAVGHAWQLSVGMDQFTIERIGNGVSVVVNGQTFVGPLTICRNAYLTDLSFVTVGGDDTTWARIAARRGPKGKTRLGASRPQSKNSKEGNEMNFDQWMAANHPDVDVSTLDASGRQSYMTMYLAADEGDDDDDEPEDESLSKEEEAAVIAAARALKKKAARKLNADRSRPAGGDGASTDKIIERATAAAVQGARMEAMRCDQIRAMANGDIEGALKAIADGTPAKDYELARLRAGRSQASGATTKVGDNEHLVMEAALLIHGGMDLNRVGKYFDEQTMNRVTAQKYRGFSLVECGDRLIRFSGTHYEGARNQTAHMQAVRSANSKLEATGFTSMSLGNILENAADKVLLDAYQSVITTWQTFCSVRSLNDFKAHSQYALDPLSVFQKVGSQGDFSNLQFGDRKYSLQADSYGVRFKIDYQTWRNDDLGAINNRIGTIGQLAASTIEQVVMVLVMLGINNTAMFHASNRNYDATASSVFGIAGLTFAETLWNNQVRQNGTPLGVMPQMLMVGTALKTQASQVYTSTKLNEVFTAAQTKTGPVASDNPFVGRYTPTMNPYLNNPLLKNNTGPTAVALSHQDNGLWMMLARMGNNAPFHVGFLDGQQSPKVELINNQTEMIGFELAAGVHFGVGYGDPLLAACFNPNAA